MGSPSRTTFVLLLLALALGATAIAACVVAAAYDAQAHFFEKQRGRLAPSSAGVEVVQGGKSQAWHVHASHAVRQGAVSA